jgi:hypothetical protein
MHVRVTNMLGKVVLEQAMPVDVDGYVKFDLVFNQRQPPGVYMIEAITKKASRVIKIIIDK